MIELKILVDDIDYNSLTELLVPLLAEKLEKDGKGGILGGVLSGNRGMAVSMARTLLNTMPQAITSTKMVRMAVARLELMPWTPILPRIAVRLANNAESPA